MENFTLDSNFLHNQRLWWLWQIWGMKVLNGPLGSLNVFDPWKTLSALKKSEKTKKSRNHCATLEKILLVLRKMILNILRWFYYLPSYHISHFSYFYTVSYCRICIKSGRGHLHVAIVISTFWIIIYTKIYEIYPTVSSWAKNKDAHSWFVFKWTFLLVLHLFNRDEKAIRENLSENCSPSHSA